jgi:uncharacterized protein (DUF433 family)
VPKCRLHDRIIVSRVHRPLFWPCPTRETQTKVLKMGLSIAPEPLPLSRDADGVIRVGHTRVTLDTIVDTYCEGATADEIVQQYPSLELADVHAVIGYYLHHRSEVEMYLKDRQAQSEAVRRDNESRFDPAGARERLLARRASRE